MEKIIQVGSPAEIYDNPSSPFAADFIGAGNFIKLKNIKKTELENILMLESRQNGIIIYKTEDHNRHSWSLAPAPLNASFPKADSGENYSGDFTFFIRPEKIKISTGKEDEPGSESNFNIYKGNLESIVFEGPDIRLIINIPKLGILKIEIKNEKKYHSLKENSEIKIYWEYEEGILFCS